MESQKSHMENNSSGQGKDAEVPVEIHGWNWGAFLLSWIWGIGNNTYRAFWFFFPFVNFFMIIALGLKGNEWAWKHRKWESVEHFKKVQRKWAKAGLIYVLVIFIFFLMMVFGMGGLFKDSEPYKMSFSQVFSSQEVQHYIGSPIESGFVSGNMQTSGPEGSANLTYSIEGPNGEAIVSVRAFMELGKWTIECLVVNYEETHEQTAIVPCE